MFKFVVLAAFVAVASASANLTPSLDGRIVGGIPVNIDEYPYQVSLLYSGSHICGGSIISTKFVVTAAHCTAGATASTLKIRAGSALLNSGGVVIPVAKINQNPEYDRDTIDYDISVLELSWDLSFGPEIDAVALPSLGAGAATGAEAICTGWGTLSEGGPIATKLQAVTVNIVSQAACKSAYGSSAITDRMVCAGVPSGGQDACQGDSGGPLVVSGKLVGIVSWGYGCARPNYPGVYSDVSNLRNYITENAGI